MKDYVKVPNEEFIKIYMECDTVKEVVKRTGMKPAAIYTRAEFLRSRGVKLPLQRGKQPLDVNSLNALILGQKAGTIGMGEVESRPQPVRIDVRGVIDPEGAKDASADTARVEGQ